MFLFLLLLAAEQQKLWPQALDSLDRSGRAVEIVVEDRLKPPALAPGAPPLLSFRYIEGQRRYRFGDLGLVMDDAGH